MKPTNHEYRGPERRHFVRIPFEAVIRVNPLQGKKGEKVPSTFRDAKAKNISTSGILFKTHERFSPGTVLELEFTIPTEEGYSEVKILGKVVRVVEVTGGEFFDNGVSFYKIKKKDEKSISNLVDFLQDIEEEQTQA